MDYPVPEIVLAEDPRNRKSFIVLDGKQRLLSIVGYINNGIYGYWNKPKLVDLKVRSDLNGLTYEELPSTDKRAFDNSSLRCTVITNYKDSQILYDIFYRLNSGSVPLATQELRQVLNKGEFGNYLIEYTQNHSPIHDVMGLAGPDERLRDVETILRVISFHLYADKYRGNLRKFLDNSMAQITESWATLQPTILA